MQARIIISFITYVVSNFILLNIFLSSASFAYLNVSLLTVSSTSRRAESNGNVAINRNYTPRRKRNETRTTNLLERKLLGMWMKTLWDVTEISSSRFSLMPDGERSSANVRGRSAQRFQSSNKRISRLSFFLFRDQAEPSVEIGLVASSKEVRKKIKPRRMGIVVQPIAGTRSRYRCSSSSFRDRGG